MRKAFTLMEVLVVLILLTVLLSLTIPNGLKMFNQLENYLRNVETGYEVNQQKSFSFIQAKQQTLMINERNISISAKGVMFENENSNVYR
jgi:prepilin-type N-terminal cleavage/methylation domain-containing protein